jgi:TonB family protein
MFDSSLVHTLTNIEVAVRIDDGGRVAEAHVVNNGSNDNKPLMNAALAAAKEWIFEPAKVHGKSVPSDHAIEFHFRPQAGQDSNSRQFAGRVDIDLLFVRHVQISSSCPNVAVHRCRGSLTRLN